MHHSNHNCGVPNCDCHKEHNPPCSPCQEESGCNPKVPAKCVTINQGVLTDFLSCNTLLDYLYNCIVANPTQYIKFCQLWAACDAATCTAPTNVAVISAASASTISGTSIIVSFTSVVGSTYDIYIDNVLTVTNATSPTTIPNVAAGNHTVTVLRHCGSATSSTTISFTICVPATDFAENIGLSNAYAILTQWTEDGSTVYDIYKNGVLLTTAATSPYVFTGLTPATLYNFKIVSRCTSGISTFYEIACTTTS